MSTDNEFPTTGSADTTAGSTPGVQSHVPGEDDTDASIGGVMPDGDALDHVDDDELPGVNGASNSGDSVGDDSDPVNGPNGTSESND
jgi:hypothetical protein